MTVTGGTAPPAQAVTMWDFSWLLRRDGAEAEYADLERVLDELADRGYDVVRVDAFPHWIADDRNGTHAETVRALPQTSTFMWGNHHPVTVRPRDALLELLHGLRARGLRAALSTWFTPDDTGRSDRIRTPDDLSRVWAQTLRVIGDAGLLDVVAYVDLCNEWPLFVPSLHDAIWPGQPAFGGPRRTWTGEEIARIDRYAAAITAIADEFGLPTLFSYCLRGSDPALADDCQRLDTTGYALAETHLWMSSTPAFAAAAAFPEPYQTPAQLALHQHRVHALWAEHRESWLVDLDGLLRRWKTWADHQQLPLWTTECWASVFWDPDASADPDSSAGADDPWAFIRRVAEHAVPLAADLGWAGIATSNFSQPHHRGMWDDAAWHRAMTTRIHAGHPTTFATTGSRPGS